MLEASIGNAVDLSNYPDNTFNVVLCFGPIYHLTNEKDRIACIEEALRVLQPGGMLAIAYINKYSVIPMLVKKEPQFVRDSVVKKVITEGYITSDDKDCFWTDAYFTTPDEIEDLLNKYNTSYIDHIGTDGLSHTISDEVDNLTEEQFTTWLNYHLSSCREKSILGLSSHGLYICKKN